MHRRDFIKYSALLGGITLLPAWSKEAFKTSRPALPVPPNLEPDASGRIRLVAQSGKSQFRNYPAATWGYNGPLLGPALRLKRGEPVSIDIYNRLSDTTTVHWHGLAIPGSADGGPHRVIAPGGHQAVAFTPDQPAATCWFHPHQHGKTGYQVAKGLAGLVIINDDESDRLRLPQQWGVDDIPVIIQDKRLDGQGQIDYQLDVMSAAVGWFGDLLLANGVNYPQFAASRGWLRLRLLNGCNARSLNLAASNNRPLYVIASDGGLLAEPVQLSELPMLPGERFEVLVEIRDATPFDLVTLPVNQMGMTLAPYNVPLPVLKLQPVMTHASGTLPDTLAALPGTAAGDDLPSRRLQLTMSSWVDTQGMHALKERYGAQAMAGMSDSMTGMHGMPSMNGMQAMHHDGDGRPHGEPSPSELMNASGINGRSFDMAHPAFNVPRGQYERWILSGEGDMMRHPFHIHGTQFRILSENGKPPAVHRQGWKDIVHVEGASSEVLVRFLHPAEGSAPYMAHCHLLEHEDTGMMLGFTVA